MIVCLVLAAASCTGQRPKLASEAEPIADETSTTAAVGAPSTTQAAEATGDEIDVYDAAASAAPTRSITADEATAAPDIPITFLVKGRSGDRLEVYLPVAPPGSTGWIRVADVSVSTVDTRVEISLSGHWLRVYQLGEVILDEPVAVGTGGDAPDAGATYYLKELLQPPDPSGPYGTYAYGLSGSTTSLTSFRSGEGIVGIHGTDDESSIGEDVDTGSIALADDVLDRLVNDIGLPLGTPVDIRR